MVEDEPVRRTPKEVLHALEDTGAMGPVVEPLGSSTVVEGLVIADGGSDGADSSGAEGGDVGLDESLSRDSAKGKSVAVEEEVPVEVPCQDSGEDEMFRPVEGSSSHKPVTKQDLAEFLIGKGLTKLFKENPAVEKAVLTAREERERDSNVGNGGEGRERERKRAEGEEALRDARPLRELGSKQSCRGCQQRQWQRV
ncbi:hypothetical protein RHMOL_Rhmol06G0168000 [Rhododendron molle]|uniref:Uncharacterized protein n=1 Tax=Rhododendron molle TaxID=49168 RepID=A0ACC0NDY0_RHOML|nr:hypothetical protein RHMOL_Rhmol06G0168000 [Rhododendron molle]